jgi:hypothetical protein
MKRSRSPVGRDQERAPCSEEICCPSILPAVRLASALVAITSAIALSHLTALFLKGTGATQLLAVCRTSAALGAISTTVAFAYFAAFLLVLTSATQPLAVAPTLREFHKILRKAGAADINSANGCAYSA